MPPLVSNRLYYFTVTSHDANGNQSAPANEVAYSTGIPTSIALGKVAYLTSGGLSSGVTLGPGASVTVAPGANVIFAPSVVAAPPSQYAWLRNGALIKGATNLTFAISNVGAANSGSYTLEVSNFTGSALSSPMVLNVVPILAASYNGLFFQTNSNGTTNFNTASSGSVYNWNIIQTGLYSGRVKVDSDVYAATGVFDVYGNSTAVTSPLTGGTSNLFLSLHLDSSLSAAQLTFSISNMDRSRPWVSSGSADSAGPYNLAPVISCVLIPAPGPYANYGHCTATNQLGQCYVYGIVPDGSAFLAEAPLPAALVRVPVYWPLYHGQGLVAGWLQLSNSIPRGTLAWVRNTAATGYTFGLTNLMTVAP